jgi:hypothetical protein
MTPALSFIGLFLAQVAFSVERAWSQIIYLAVQATQQFNQTLAQFLASANSQWDATGTDQFYAVLVGDNALPLDTDSTLADIGSGGTEAQVAADTAAYIASGDGAPIDVPTRSIVNTSGAAEFRWGDLAFGTGLTITGVAALVICRGNVAAISSTDDVVWHMDLDDGATEVSVTNGTLTIQAPTNNNWFQINAQA